MRRYRTIFWRAVILQNGERVTAGGAFGDLKTLKGATSRVIRRFPDRWQSVEAQFTPFDAVPHVFGASGSAGSAGSAGSGGAGLRSRVSGNRHGC